MSLVELEQAKNKAAFDALEIAIDKSRTPAEIIEAREKAEAELKKYQDALAEIHKKEEQDRYLDQARKAFSNGGELVPFDRVGVDTVERVARTVADQLFEDPAFMKMYDADRPNVFSTGPIKVKATLTETTAGGTTGGGLAQPQVTPGILPILFQPLTVEDLIPGGQTGAALVRYLKETVATNAAAAVAEGAAKPASTLNFAAVDEPVRKVATTIKVTDEMMQDVPAIRSYIDNRLTLFVQLATEAQILSGAGTGANLTGILNRAGLTAAQAIGTDTAPDAIYKDITKIRVASFLEPDGIVIHPNNWQTIRLAKDANNQYYGGGPFTAAYGAGGGMAPDMLWGKRVVVTTAMTAGTALVGAFGTAAQIFNNGGLTVEATNSNEDDFLNNLIALRAERRLALAIYRPSAFSTVTGLT
jgi:HK97 family phage major capsid protein